MRSSRLSRSAAALALATALLGATLLGGPASAQQGSGAEAAGSAVSEGPLAQARAGDEAFDAGDFEEAAARYLASGISSESVHFNLGIAFAHLGDFGEATYHLTQAHFLDPGDGEIEDNLALVRAEADRQRAEASRGAVTLGVPPAVFWLELFHLVGGLPLDLAILAAAWLGFGALLVRRRVAAGPKRDALLVAGIVLVLVLVAGITYRVGAAVTEAEVTPGVVTVLQPLVYAGPDRSAPRRVEGELSIGAVVLIEERRDEWVRVVLDDGRDGWLRDGDLREVRVE